MYFGQACTIFKGIVADYFQTFGKYNFPAQILIAERRIPDFRHRAAVYRCRNGKFAVEYMIGSVDLYFVCSYVCRFIYCCGYSGSNAFNFFTVCVVVPPEALGTVIVILSAQPKMISFNSAPVRVGFAERSNAATPVTCGAAADVPLKLT